jgi:hypothetical protein
MRRPRFQLTIRHSLALIAVCAVCFALLRTSIGCAVLWAGSVFPGFLIARARGGHGIFGGAFAFSAMTTLLFLVAGILFASHHLPFARSSVTFVVLGFVCLGFPAALGLGLLVSGALYLIVEVTQILLHMEPLAIKSGPRRLYPEPHWPVQVDNLQGEQPS